MSEDKTLTIIPHFDGQYAHWSEMMESLLKAKDLSTSKIVWDSLKKKLGGSEKVKRALRNNLRREFKVLEMEDRPYNGYGRDRGASSSRGRGRGRDEDEDEYLLMVETDEVKEDDMWFIDSGCSNHMCNKEAMFTMLDKTFSHSVKLGNNDKLLVTGKEIVKMNLKGNIYTISEVYFVPQLKNNLLSVEQL
ncbi:hypothetical protein LIER_35322 [Lithospermum erythrorhizon]|uniref:Retrovirus-related Pol polyprotein from transposon TNT 1-94-like beta-barrel domain-containing protein n=1 Tax=Lithospermum erythrorhizon TaxID=34254 RepID=A0AAV3NNZ1_LITER